LSASEKKLSSSRFSIPGILVEGFLDLAQEAAADDASAAPHERDAAHVQVPAVLFGGGPEQHVALRVGDDLGAVKGAAHLFNKRGAVAGRSCIGRALPGSSRR
jgi:hypothetical protein